MKVRATKLIYTKDLKRIKAGEIFELKDDKDFSKHSMEKVDASGDPIQEVAVKPAKPKKVKAPKPEPVSSDEVI